VKRKEILAGLNELLPAECIPVEPSLVLCKVWVSFTSGHNLPRAYRKEFDAEFEKSKATSLYVLAAYIHKAVYKRCRTGSRRSRIQAMYWMKRALKEAALRNLKGN